MKHTAKVTLMLLAIFFLAQVLGIFAVAHSMEVETLPDGNVSVTYPDTAVGERPDMDGISSFLYILASIGIGTGLLLVLIRFRKLNIWKIFFFLAIWMSTAILLGVFIDPNIGLVIAFILALAKLKSRNFILFNITEVLMYGGITVLFAPLLEIWWMAALLIIISVYDMFAVWQSKHMVKMAKSMTKNNVFAGFTIPYKAKKKTAEKRISEKDAKDVENKKHQDKQKKSKIRDKKEKVNIAILGGGDVAFPLLFAGTAVNFLVKSFMLPKYMAFLQALLIPVFVTLALFLLFWKAKKDKFYPAMPFVSAGAFAGFAIILAINFII